MADFLRYNPQAPDPISVAGHIVRFYAKKEHIYGEALQHVYDEALTAAEQVLPGKSDIDLQTAIDLVEQARTGKTYAKLIPRSPDLRQSITARKIL